MSNVSSSNGLGKYPKLRFKGFFEPWNATVLSDTFKKNSKKNTNGSITNVICNSAKNGLIPQREYFDKDIANADNTDGYYIIEKDDFVYNPRKSTEAPYGPVSIYKYAEQGIVSPLYLCFRALHPINAEFFDFYFKSTAWHRYIYLSGDSGARHDRVSIRDDIFFAMPINLPSNEEQYKISSLLTLIEKKIKAQAALVENLKKYKRGLLKQVFNENCTWDEVPLGKIATIYQPQTISSEQLVENGKYPVYGANGQIGWYNDFNHDSEQIAICCRGASCGTVNYIPAYSWITGNAMVINIADSIILKKFVYHQLCSQNLSYMISGSGQPQIVRTPCVEHKIFVPTSEVQAKITALFDLLDQKIAIQEKVLDTLIITKKGYLQKLFV